MSLLAIRFTPQWASEDPGGMIELLLAGGGAIRLTVECIDAELADLTGPWAARGRPGHDGGRADGAPAQQPGTRISPPISRRCCSPSARPRKTSPHRCKRIIADVRARGDAALVELTNKFDRANVTAATLKLSAAEIDAALAQVTAAQHAAIETAAARIEAYHRRQLPAGRQLHRRYRRRRWAGAGPRWTAPGFMSRAAPPLIPLRC